MLFRILLKYMKNAFKYMMIMGQELRPEKTIIIGSYTFEHFNEYTYLGCNVNVDNNITAEIKNTNMKSKAASSASGVLSKVGS